MKSILALSILFMLSACSNVDKHVRLLGEYNDHKDEKRYEVYLRLVDISEPSRLKHREEPMFLSEDEIRKFVLELKSEEKERSVIEEQVKKDIENGRGLHLPKDEEKK